MILYLVILYVVTQKQAGNVVKTTKLRIKAMLKQILCKAIENGLNN
jgi:hypothetical protein